MKSPIFIGGLDNSGKTHLRLALSSHPNIAMTRRSYMWTRAYNRYGDLSERENFERCLKALLSRKDVRTLQPDPERIRREFWQGELTYGRLFALLHEHYAERLGRSRWGEQEAGIEQYADEIFTAYPSARIIHMLRDPRNRYDEMLRTTPPAVRLGRVGINTTDWLQSARVAGRHQQRYPENYMVLAYESLVSQPEDTLRKVCAFLGEDYAPAMLTLEGAIGFGEGNGTGGSSELEIGVVEFRLDGSHTVSPREVAFMQALAQKEMTERGYTQAEVRFSPSEALLYYGIDWPFSLMRVVMQRIRPNHAN
ncbi:MAG TPA: sulfotransferase [Anaerolineales bacterium]|nr:sulfotransferase [Anaerolineales bacterium]